MAEAALPFGRAASFLLPCFRLGPHSMNQHQAVQQVFLGCEQVRAGLFVSDIVQHVEGKPCHANRFQELVAVHQATVSGGALCSIAHSARCSHVGTGTTPRSHLLTVRT